MRFDTVAPAEARPLLWAAAACGLAAEVVGRWMFYALYSRVGV
jgi:DMSO reductase anchor subunit